MRYYLHALILILVIGMRITEIDYFLILLTIGISIINLYGTAYYRLNLNYSKILLMNTIRCTGHLVGLFLYFIFNYWSLIFFLSELLGIIYLFFTTPLFNMKFEKSANKSIEQIIALRRDYFNLLSSSLISNIIVYFDRLLINPILGEKAVTQYYVASLTGKTFSMVTTPISTVLLSYTTKYKNNISKKTLRTLGFFILLLIIIGMPLLNLISPIVINLLYPNFYGDSIQYVYLANIVVLTNIASSLLNVLILSKSDLKWQSRINITYGLLFIGLGVILTSLYGLYGFCISSIISNIVRLVFLYLVGILTIEKTR